MTEEEQIIVGNNEDDRWAIGFWGIWAMLITSSIIYIYIWNMEIQSVAIVNMLAIYSSLFLFGAVLSGFQMFKMKVSFVASCVWFTIGWWFQVFFKFLGRLGGNNSFIFSVTSPDLIGNNIFSVATTTVLPIFLDYFFNRVTIPVVEEMFFLFAIPYTIIKIFDSLANVDNFKFFGNPILKMFTILGVSISVFIGFHRNFNSDVGFVIGALVFRLLAMGLIWWDEIFNIIDIEKDSEIKRIFGAVAPSLSLGMHMSLNFMYTGMLTTIGVLASDGRGIPVLIFLGIIQFIGIGTLLYVLSKKSGITGN